MSEIKKYKKYLNFKANPRYLTRDFIVPLYTGTEPDILDDSNTQRESSVYKEFPNEMPIVSPKEIQNQPYEQLQLNEGGRVGGARFGYYKKIGDKNIKKPTHTIQGNKWPDKETKNFYEEQIKERFKYAKNSNELLKKYESGKLLTNEQLAKKYNVSIPVIKRINKTVVKDLELENKPVIGREESLKKTDIERKKAQLKFSNRYFEQKVKGSYKAHLGHMGDLYNRIVTGKNLGYTPVEINQAMSETLDPILRGISKAQDELIENKPPGWKKKLRLYNQKGINYSSLAEGYKSFDIINPNTLEKYTYGVDYLKTIDPAALYKGKPIKEIAQLTDKDELNKIKKAFDNLTEAKKIARRKGLEQADISKIKNSELLTEENLRKLQNFKAFEENREAVLKAQSKIPVSKTFKTQMITKISKIKDQMIANIGCPTLVSKSIGGRVNFSNGSNCYAKGLEKIQSGELNTSERNIAANFLKDAGADAKTIGFIKNAKNLGSFLFDFTIGKTPGAALVNFGINVPFAIAEAQEGKPGRQVLGTATDVIGLGPLVGTTEKDELTKAMGADADLYLKINNAMDEYNDIDRQRQLIENSRSGFQSPEEIPSDMREQELQLASKKLNQKEKELYNFLSPYLNKQKEVIYPKNIEKGLQILEDQERLRKSKSNLEMKNIPSVGEDILSTDNISFEKSNKNIDKKIEQLESEKLLYGSEIDKNMTPELMDVIYESGARGGAAEGGRIGLSGGGGPKMGRRGFLGLIAGAAAAPDLIKAIKGTGQAGKIASKIKFEKTEGMYPWFPDLVEKIKTKGKPFEEKEIIMEASYKHEPKGYGGLPKGEETVTRHVDGDTEFLLREYPDGRIAVDIHSPRNQEGSSTPVTLYYRPTMELKYYSGVKVEPAEFKVLEKEPRYFANGPDDVDIEMSETRKIPGKNTIYGDVEAAERFATGKIENRKIIPAKQARREQMEDAPTDFIEETSPYGPVYD
jgi:hypothetical protein